MEPHDRDRWDAWLDKALQKYGSINPHPALESRVLTSLQVQQRVRTRRVWTWTVGVAAAAFLVLFVWRGLEDPGLNKHDKKPIAHVSQDSPKEHRVQALPPVSQGPSALTRARSERRHRDMAKRSTNPRLERFPSPRPLSPQELAALRYAGRYPQEAVLVAKEQEKFDDEVRQAQQQVETSFSISNE